MRGFWIKAWLVAAALISGSAASAQAVQQSGAIAPYHLGSWASNSWLQDGGSPDSPAVNALGLFGGTSCSFGISSQTSPGVSTKPYSALTICQSPTTTTFNVAGVNGQATPTVQFNIGGTIYPFPQNGATSITGPYAGQVTQPLSSPTTAAYFPADCLNIFSYLTPTQQAAVQTGTSTVDFSPILVSAMNALQTNKLDANSYGTNKICLPAGTYPLNETVDIHTAVIIEGAGGAGYEGQNTGTAFVVPANTSAFIVNTQLTDGPNTITPPPYLPNGANSVLRDLAIIAKPGTTVSATYGIWARATMAGSNLFIRGFPYGIYANACGSTGPTSGAADGLNFDRISVEGYNGSAHVGIDGIHLEGCESNTAHITKAVVHNQNGWCFYDNSFYGADFVTPESAGCGFKSRVNYSGASYVAAPTTTSALLASTTPGTNSAIWVPITYNAGYATWNGTGPWYPGGDYFGNTSLFLQPYTEGGSPNSYGYNSLAIGGEQPTWNSGAPWINEQTGTVVVNPDLKINGNYSSETTSVGLQLSAGVPFQYCASTNFSGCFQLGQSGPDLRLSYGLSSGQDYGFFTGINTAYTFGRTAPVPGVEWITRLAIPDINGNLGPSRFISACTASPTTTGDAVGEICINASAARGQPMGWVETTQGSPDTWSPLALVPIPPSTVSGLPSCGSSIKGAKTYVTDASSPTYLGALTGGSSVVAPVFCNGSSWLSD